MRGSKGKGAVVAVGVIAMAGTLGTAVGAAVGEARAEAPPRPGTVAITVTANGFRNTNGQAIVAIYDTKDSWLKLDKALRKFPLKITGGTLTTTISEMPPGIYAVSVIHDENSNGKLDMHWLPIPGPDEGAGVSNDATATFGPPSYGDARLQIGDKGGVVTLKIRY